MKSSFLLFFFLWAITGFSQGRQNLRVHPGVDTLSTESRAVYMLMADYLNSRPDSIYDNKLWNTRERLLFNDFDFTRSVLYRSGLDNFEPMVLSISPEKDSWLIKTAWVGMRNGLPEIYAILKYFAVKEEGEWKLKNALSAQSENWQKYKRGIITYRFPEGMMYDLPGTIKAMEFVEELSGDTGVAGFDYYVCSSPEQLKQLSGIELSPDDFSKGLVMPEQRIIVSGTGNFNDESLLRDLLERSGR